MVSSGKTPPKCGFGWFSAVFQIARTFRTLVEARTSKRLHKAVHILCPCKKKNFGMVALYLHLPRWATRVFPHDAHQTAGACDLANRAIYHRYYKWLNESQLKGIKWSMTNARGARQSILRSFDDPCEDVLPGEQCKWSSQCSVFCSAAEHSKSSIHWYRTGTLTCKPTPGHLAQHITTAIERARRRWSWKRAALS